LVIRVPMTLAVLRCLLVRAGAHRYALPMHSTATAREARDDAVVSVDGRPALLLDGEPVRLTPLTAALGLGDDGPFRGPAVILGTTSGRHAFGVDELLGQRDVVVKDVGRVLGRLPLVAGASVEPDGSVMLVLDPEGLIAAAGAAPAPIAAPAGDGEPERAPRILVVDDALTIRELQRTILERAGYDVTTAADGEDALRQIGERPADLVLTDIEMPRMDGFALTAAIRERDDATPVLILTSRAGDEDRRRGLAAGADGYLVKSAFDAGALLEAVEDLLP
jgi:two-component system chemotaxis sensor kinase CheA